MTALKGAASERRLLRKLARANGIQTGFRGTDGKRHAASDEALIGVLKALGVQIHRVADATDRLRETLDAKAHKLTEPVVAVREGAPLRLTLRLPASLEPDEVRVGLQGPEGLSFDHAAELEVTKAAGTKHESSGAQPVVRWTLELDSSRLRPGYHDLVVEAGSRTATTTVICAPAHCPSPLRSWGTSIPLYALRSGSDWGVGSFADLAHLARWTHGLGARFLSTLPLCAVFDDVPFADPSPYMPASRLAWNDVYVDIEAIPEVAISPETRAELESAELGERLRDLRERRSADPRAVAAAKRKLLEILACALVSQASARREEFENYAARHPEAVRYALFRSRCEQTQKPFQEWQGADAALTDDLLNDDAAKTDARGLAHLYGQWIAEQQLASVRESGVGLHLDIPVGVHPASFDLWSHPESFATGASGGAPPDDFFAGGQLWGFAPLHPERVRENGYRYFSAFLRHSMCAASSVRIDHVMGLHRLYWVPQGSDPTDGAYVRYRADELHAVVSLEAHLAGTAVVGEDLGTVPGSVRRAMERDRMLRSFVFEFSSNVEDPLPVPQEWSIASLATHDLPPFASFWRALDVVERRARNQIDSETADAEVAERALWRSAVLDALGDRRGEDLARLRESGDPHALDDESVRSVLSGCLVHLASSPATLVPVDLEDLWVETEPQNRPGTGPEEGNFLRRASRRTEEIEVDRKVVEILENVARARTGDSSGPVATRNASNAGALPVQMGG